MSLHILFRELDIVDWSLWLIEVDAYNNNILTIPNDDDIIPEENYHLRT